MRSVRQVRREAKVYKLPDQGMMRADILANLGGLLLEKSQDADPTNPAQGTKGYEPSVVGRLIHAPHSTHLRGRPSGVDLKPPQAAVSKSGRRWKGSVFFCLRAVGF